MTALFWDEWRATKQKIFWFNLVLMAVGVAGLVFFWNFGFENAAPWGILSEQNDLSVVIDVFKNQQFQFATTTPNYFVTEQFVAAPFQILPWATNAYALLVVSALILLLACVSAMPRVWYLASMVLFIGLLTTARFETLGVFGYYNQGLLLALMTLFCGLSYYFHVFAPQAQFGARVLAFTIAWLASAVVVSSFSKITVPALAVVSYATPALLAVAVGFIFMTAVEIPAGLVWIVSNRQTARRGLGSQSAGLGQLLLVYGLYLVTLTLVYLKNSGDISSDFLTVSPFTIYIVSLFLGIWGYRERLVQAEAGIFFREVGAWLYLALGIMATAFVAWAFATANEPLTNLLEDWIIYTQLAATLLMLVYVLLNFAPLLQQGKSIHKVLYRPIFFKFGQLRVATALVVLVLVALQSFDLYPKAAAGYYNALGDLYASTNELKVSESYYKMALEQQFQNHKSNYALASLALRQGDRPTAGAYFRQALLKNPSPQAYVGLSNTMLAENLFFDAIFNLRAGLVRFPKNGEIENNLGYLYAKTSVADSAFAYLDRAQTHSQRPEVAQANLLAFWLKNPTLTNADSLLKALPQVSYVSFKANQLALSSLQKDFSVKKYQNFVPADSILDVPRFSYLYNFVINQAKASAAATAENKIEAGLLGKLADKNIDIADDLLTAEAYQFFYRGQKLTGLERLQALAEGSRKRADFYYKTLGIWFLQLNLLETAQELFSKSKDTEAKVGRAVVLLEQQKNAAAKIILDSLATQSASVGAVAQLLLKQTNRADVALRPSLVEPIVRLKTNQQKAAAFDAALQQNPFEAKLVVVAATFFHSQKQTKKGYQILIDALAYNKTAPQIWEAYALMALDRGLSDFAAEGAEQVRQLAPPADYQTFLNRYQAKRALIEKARQDFK